MKTKSIIIIFACVLAAAFALGAAGVISLGGDEQPKGSDRLIGILVTTEYLDLFDDEAYFEENMQQIMSGGNPDASDYQERLYGQLIDRTDYAEDGTPIHSKEYAFSDVDGIFCYAAKIDNGAGEPYTTTGGEGAADAHLYINTTDDGEDVRYECTLCVNADSQTDLYFNPVYRTADGKIYAVSGDSFAYNGGPEGDVYGVTYDEKYTVTENGKENTDSFAIAVQTRYVYPAGSVSIIQMDADSAILARDEYTLSDLPEAVTPASSTQYIVVESHSTDPQGNFVTDREIYQPSNIEADIFIDRGDGLCVPQTVRIEWQ